jgi:hypothetical protein
MGTTNEHSAEATLFPEKLLEKLRKAERREGKHGWLIYGEAADALEAQKLTLDRLGHASLLVETKDAEIERLRTIAKNALDLASDSCDVCDSRVAVYEELKSDVLSTNNKGRKTLKELIRFPYIFSCNKYNYAEDADEHATDKIDKLSISQFLDVLSDALEEILND